MSRILEGKLDAQGMRVALVVARFNQVVSSRLLGGAEDCLDRHGGDAAERTVVWVPGSWELPQAAQPLAASGRFDAVIALGALVRGETPHFDVLAGQVARGLAQVSEEAKLPVIFGVLTTDTVDQAVDRAGGKLGNKGWEAALSAIEMVNVLRQIEN